MTEHAPGQLPDFPDVATPVARTTVPPPFEQIVARARRRRRRTVLGVVAVTAAMVGAVATATALDTGHQDTAPQPTKPSGNPTSTATATTVEAARIVLTGTLGSYAAGPHGSLLTVWTACGGAERTGCHSAWQLQTAGDTFQGLADGDYPAAYSAGDSFVVKSRNREGILVDEQGRARTIAHQQRGTVSAGDVLVGQGKGLAVVDPTTGRWWPLPVVDGTEGWAQGAVSSTGTTWAMSASPGPAGGSTVWHRDQGGSPTWQAHPMPADRAHTSVPVHLAVLGDHVAAVSGYDGATVSPLADYAVTADGGRTWTDLHQGDVPFRTVDMMAATSDGTLYVVEAGGHPLFRSTDASWTRFAAVSNPDGVDELVPAGDHVIGRGGTLEHPVLVSFDSDGRGTRLPLSR